RVLRLRLAAIAAVSLLIGSVAGVDRASQPLPLRLAHANRPLRVSEAPDSSDHAPVSSPVVNNELEAAGSGRPTRSPAPSGLPRPSQREAASQDEIVLLAKQ